MIEVTIERRIAALRRIASDQRDTATVLRILGAPGEADRAASLALAVDLLADVLEARPTRSTLAKETGDDRIPDPRD